MADQITLERALELVEFELLPEGWRVKHVKSDVWGNVCGHVRLNVYGNVYGNVSGTIKNRRWKLIETPKEELKRLVKEGAGKDELLAVIDRLENSNV